MTSKSEIAKADQLKKLQMLLDRTAQYSNFLNGSMGGTFYTAAPEETVPPSASAPAAPAATVPAPPVKKGPSSPTKKSLADRIAQLPGKKDQPRVAQPPTVTGGQLRPYQLDALNWLIQLFENGMNGILADQMGLGKTITTISLIAHLWHMGVHGPFLIVAPVSTLANWISEFEKWTPTIPIVMYHGAKDERAKLREEILHLQKRQRRKMDPSAPAAAVAAAAQPSLPVVITSYEIAIRDCRHLMRHSWKYLVVDEAHRLKNFECKLIIGLRQLRTESRLLLTGTPLQNSLAELWSLLNFLLPELFDDLNSFKKWFDFTTLLESDAPTNAQLHGELVEKLHNVLKPFLLRRLKQDVEISIPQKAEVVIFTSLTPNQAAFYNAVKDKSFSHQGMSYTNLLMQLRKVCNHPFLFPQEIIRKVFQEDVLSPSATPSPAPAPAPTPAKSPEPMAVVSPVAEKARGEEGDDDDEEEDEDEDEDVAEVEIGEGGSRIVTRAKNRGPDRQTYAEPDEDDIPERDEDEDDVKILAPRGKTPEPKAPRSAWNVFCGEKWAEYHLSRDPNEPPDRLAMFRMNAKFSAEWATMADEQRQVYYDKLEEERRVCQELLWSDGPDGAQAAPSVDRLVAASGKLHLLHKMLPALKAAGHKVLLFSQMTRLLDILQDYLDAVGHRYSRIDGSVAQAERQRQIDVFNSDPDVFVFLLSTRAGGQGINLAAADTVIIYDSDWNPQMDLQAQDRCHRIGQTRPVVVYRLITANTVDSRILKRARSKLFLERLVVGKGSFSRRGTSTKLTLDDLRELLLSKQDEHAITNAELTKMLDREYVLQQAAAARAAHEAAEKKVQQDGTAAAGSSASASAAAAAAAASSSASTTSTGFQYVPESRIQF